MNQSVHADQVEKVVRFVRDLLGIRGDQRTISATKMKPAQRKEVKRIIRDSKLPRRKICNILCINEYELYTL